MIRGQHKLNIFLVKIIQLFPTTLKTRLGSSVSNSNFRLKVLVLAFKLYVKSM